jgi:outer membrane receptor protein involved in Fe transport
MPSVATRQPKSGLHKPKPDEIPKTNLEVNLRKLVQAQTISAFMLLASAGASVAQAQNAAPAGGGDIVVTATRDKSLLSKTPIAMSAVGGDNLRSAGVSNASALKDVAPEFRSTGPMVCRSPSAA